MRKASHSLSERTGREYSSVASTGLATSSSWSMYCSWCANALLSAPARLSITRLQLFWTPIHLCASTVTESARSRPAKRRAQLGTAAAGTP